MHPLHFYSVISLGTAIAAMVTVLIMLLTPTLGGGRAVRVLSLSNLCFTLMLATRLSMGETPSHPGYALIWSLLISTSMLSVLALQVLAGTPRRLLRAELIGFAVVMLALWLLLWARPTALWASVLTGAASLVCYLVGIRASMSLAGAHLALPRRTLTATFASSGVFAALHVVQRLADIANGVTVVPATAMTYFGASLLFCATNLGFLLLLYLQAAERVNRLAQTDELTGTLNRRGFAEQLTRLRADPATESDGALLLIDIDRFKSVNDSHGHAVGDEVLRWFAATLRRFMRRDDLLMRMGGEEFCLLLPGVSDEDAAAVAERIRIEFEANSVAATSAGPLRITASFGVAPFAAADVGLDARLRQADEALYAAKRGGRNRVVRWGPELTVAPA